jgi:hypothetical protein
MKYFDLIKASFPGQECTVSISDVGGDVRLTVKVGDFAMHLNKELYIPVLSEKEIDEALPHMIKVMKKSIAEINAKRKLPQEDESNG